ncbi:MAG: hypothetical protein RLZZ458_2908, partial [Planctomycetota bacterium]
MTGIGIKRSFNTSWIRGRILALANEKVEEFATKRLTILQDAIASLCQRLVRYCPPVN